MTEDKQKFRALVLTKIAQGHQVTLKKGVSAKKSPTGKAIKAVKKRVPSVASKNLFSRSFKQKHSLSDQAVGAELSAMRAEGIIHCTNGMWWKR